MLAEVVRFELHQRARAPSTWLYAALILAGAMSQALDPVRRLTPGSLATELTLDGLFAIVVSVALFGGAALRDVDARMETLLFTTPLRTRDYLGGRFLAAWLVNAALLLAIPIGYALAPLAALAVSDTTATGPFSAQALLQPWVIFLLPNMTVSGAVLFAVAVFSRRLTPVYIVGFVLWFGSMFLADVDVVFDPAGVGALRLAIRTWSPADASTRIVGLSGAVLWNRLAWLTGAGVILGVLVGRFRRGRMHAGSAARAKRREPEHTERVPVRTMPLETPIHASFGPATTIRQTMSIARMALLETAANRWFAAVLVLCAAWSAILVDRTNQQPFDAPSWPATMLVTTILSRDFLVGLYIVACFYAGELVWKDRVARMAEIADAAPVGTGTLVLGRYVALVAMLAMCLVASMAGGIGGQLAADYGEVEPGLYLRVLLGMDLAQAALIAALILAVQTIVNHRYLGVLAAVASLIIPFAGVQFGHVLRAYGADAGWVYSDMNGFGPFLAPFVWLKVYAAGWALLLGVLAALVWVRGSERGARARLRSMRRRLGGAPRRTALAAVVLIVSAGGVVLYNEMLGASSANGAHDDVEARRAAYDARYSRFAGVAQPSIARARLRVEIHPDDRAVEVSGSYQMVNRTGVQIDSVHVTTSPRLVTHTVAFSRTATPVVMDTALGYRIYALAQPLMPGDSMQLSFESAFRERGFSKRSPQTDVVRNGTTLDREWLPSIGYARGENAGRNEHVRVETIIGTAADQIAVAPGVARREWMERGRRYFEYDTELPQPFDAPMFSARYAMRSAVWTDSSNGSTRDVAVAVYHHPAHDRNVDTFLRSMHASLAYYTAQFGPYPGAVLRIVETPRYHEEFRSYATLLAFSEGPFIAKNVAGGADYTFFDTAHEIAHQWWGIDVRGATPEAGRQRALVELLADYSALVVTEHTLGVAAARRVRAARELRLLSRLRDGTGERTLNAALHRALCRRLAGGAPDSFTRDLLSELRATVPDSIESVLDELLEPARTGAVR